MRLESLELGQYKLPIVCCQETANKYLRASKHVGSSAAQNRVVRRPVLAASTASTVVFTQREFTCFAPWEFIAGVWGFKHVSKM